MSRIPPSEMLSMTTLASNDPNGGRTYSPTALESQAIIPKRPSQARQASDASNASRRKEFWLRFKGKTRVEVPGVVKSLKAFATSSVLNVFLIFIPFAWVAHFEESWNRNIAFALCFLSIIPLESLFDYGGEQMALYCGQDLGDLVIVTLNNAVEATLAILLLTKCDLKLLQSTIAGVVLLHLLLIPGTAFLTGGARVWEQDLHPHATQLNHALLAIGVLSLLIPAAYFSALNPSVAQATAEAANTTADGAVPFISDLLRDDLLRMSRGMAVILLIVYICSRVFLFDPPGEGNALSNHPDTPEAIRLREAKLREEEPEVNPWVCIAILMITVGVMAATAEFLVDSIEFVREDSKITSEWFGIILLPILSFSGDAIVAIVFFIKTALLQRPETPESLAKGRAIDLSIQFTLFWMPFLVLLGWWSNKPLTLLFDLFEVSLLIGACFLVNYVTADAKTNWAEGVMLVAFYFMIALVSWYYPGQNEISFLLACGSVEQAVAAGNEA